MAPPTQRRFLFVLALLILLLVPFTVASANDNNVNWNELGHNSRDPLYRYPQGAVPTGTEVTLRLRALNGDLTQAQVRVWNDRANTSTIYNMNKVAGGVNLPNDPATYEFWEVTLPSSAVSTVYWYRFIATDGSATAYYEDDAARLGGWGEPFGSSPDYGWQLTHYDPAFQTPDWIKNAVVYQIFVDRFRDGNPANNPSAGEFFYGNFDTIVRSNDTGWNTAICDPRNRPGSASVCPDRYSQNFYGGDLQGIIDQLDYLQGLGVTALYLNPIFESPSNHKYDTTNFMLIDDNFGDLALFQQLASEADARGIRIILDGVFNHTSSDSIYFDRYSRWDVNGLPTTIRVDDDSGACESLASPYINWFPFKPYTGSGTAPCSDNRDYNYWFGIFDSLPVMNHDNAGVRDYFIDNGTLSVGPYWMQWADGWRLDVAPEVDHGTINDPNDDYWEDFRAAVRAVNPDTYIVGEEWGNATAWTIDSQWDATMNYQYSSAFLSYFRDTPFVDNDHNSGSSAGVLNPLTPTEFNERILNWRERYAPEAYYAMMNLLGSHDTSRAVFMLDENTGANDTALYNDPNYDWSDAINRLAGVGLVQMTMPGAPTTYYGDELALVNPPAYDGSQWQDDPYNRAPFPWLDQSGTPYYTHLQNAALQAAFTDYYAALTAARHAHPALRIGEYIPAYMDDATGVYAYLRRTADDSDMALIVINNSASPQSASIDLGGWIHGGSTWTDYLTAAPFTADGDGVITVTNIPVNGGYLLFPNTPQTGRPAAVTDLSATAGANQIDLDWADVPGALSYDVYRSRLSHGGYEYLGNASGSSGVDFGLENSVTYWYKVVAVAANGLTSPDSNEVSAIPGFDLGGSGVWFNLQWPPTIDHVLNATNPTPGIYGQLWIDGVTSEPGATPGISAEVGFGPYEDDPSDPSWTWFPMTFNTNAGNNDEFVGTLLPDEVGTFNYTTRYSADGGNTWFYAQLGDRGYNPDNVGVLTVTAPTDAIPPAAPTNLTVTGSTAVSISLGWDAHPNTDSDLYGFRIYRTDEAGGTALSDYDLIDTVANPDATSYTDDSVTSGSSYEYVITAIDTSLNESDPSNAVTGEAVMLEVQVTLRVIVPDHTPDGETVYVAGNFGEGYPEWEPGTIALTEVSEDVWEYQFTILDGTTVEYKYTRGSWDKVEKGADGNFEIANRQAAIEYGAGGTQLIENTVENWRDPYVISTMPTDGTTVGADTDISATWNQAMNASSVTDPAGFTITPAVSGTLSYDDPSRTLSFAPDAPLAAGEYEITISGRSDAGGDTQQLDAVWSFTVVTPPPATTLIAPMGDTTDTMPTFIWEDVAEAERYYLWLSTASDTLILDQWYEDTIACNGTTCEVTPGLNLTNDVYNWRVQTWNAAGGYGAWTNTTSFTVAVPTAAPTLIAPTGTLSEITTQFNWTAVDAEWYLLWISRSDGTLVDDLWYESDTVCTGDSCAVTPPISLNDGEHSWWVLAWHPLGGNGAWSEKGSFTVTGVTNTGGVPVEIMPLPTVIPEINIDLTAPPPRNDAEQPTPPDNPTPPVGDTP